MEKGKESVNFLVMGNVFYEGDKGIPHSHVMGIGFTNEANRGLGVDSAVKDRCQVGILEGCI